MSAITTSIFLNKTRHRGPNLRITDLQKTCLNFAQNPQRLSLSRSMTQLYWLAARGSTQATAVKNPNDCRLNAAAVNLCFLLPFPLPYSTLFTISKWVPKITVWNTFSTCRVDFQGRRYLLVQVVASLSRSFFSRVSTQLNGLWTTRRRSAGT